MADRNIYPNGYILDQIFPDGQPETISIFLQDWDKCIFKAEFAQHSRKVLSACVVRLECVIDDDNTLVVVAAIQRVAAMVLPELVPKTLRVGRVKDSQGRNFNFSITEFVEGDLLEDMWEEMSPEEQSSVAAEVIEALKKLHCTRLSDRWVRDLVDEVLIDDGHEHAFSLEKTNMCGGPHTGFGNDGRFLLDSVMTRRKSKKPSCTSETLVGSKDIRIRSSFEELGSMIVSASDMDAWPGESVLCHHDLSPRNLILQSQSSSDMYQELSLHDTYLSGANRHLSFCLSLKDHMKQLVPRSSSQIVLLQAMELIYESRQKSLLNGNNIPTHIRKRFIEIFDLVRDDDPYVGWSRSSQAGPMPDCTRAAMQILEDGVIKEVIARRKP